MSLRDLRTAACAVVGIVATFGSSFPAGAQELIAVLPSANGPVDRVGDVDGDGLADVLYSHPENSGTVFIRRGTGEPILQVASGVALTFLGDSLSGVGDLDQDGVPDFLAQANENTVRAYSGATGQLLFTTTGSLGSVNFGGFIDEVGDIDLDGRPDFVASSTKAAFACSGAGGGFLFTYPGIAFDGVGVSGLDDVDGDGIGDFAIAAPKASATVLQGGPGLLRVHSGATGALLFQREGDSPSATFGRAVARIGDLDGDGHAEILVSSLTSSPAGEFGRTQILSPTTGAVLRTYSGYEPGADGMSGDSFGNSLASIADLDGDGLPDLIIGVASIDWLDPGDGGALVFSSASSQPLAFTICPPSSPYGEFWGSSVASPGDVDGDTIPDFAINAPGFFQSGGGTGSLRVYSGNGDTVTPFGEGCTGSGGFTPTLDVSLVSGNALQLSLGNGLGGTTALVFVGAHPGHLSLGYGCSFFMEPIFPNPIVLTLGGAGPGAGSVSYGTHLPPGITGYALFQAFLLDSGTTRGFSGTAAQMLSHY